MRERLLSSSGLWLIFAIYIIIYGVTSKSFSFRSKGWRPGEERVEFKPNWRQRLLVVFPGILLAIDSLLSLSGWHWRR